MCLLLLVFVLLLFVVQVYDDYDYDYVYGSLGKYEYGVVQLNVVLDGKIFELELDSLVMNLVGFEYVVSIDVDKVVVVNVCVQLEKLLELFVLLVIVGCLVVSQELWSLLFGDKVLVYVYKEKVGYEYEYGYVDIYVYYQFSCEKFELFKLLIFVEFFKCFFVIQKIQV